MYLAYLHLRGFEAQAPVLCMLPDKPDEFTVPSRIDSLQVTEAALYRLGPLESAKIEVDPNDGGLVIEPVRPAKLYLTPNLPQSPGMTAKRIKIFRKDTGDSSQMAFETQYLQDGVSKEEWLKWEPNKTVR